MHAVVVAVLVGSEGAPSRIGGHTSSNGSLVAYVRTHATGVAAVLRARRL